MDNRPALYAEIIRRHDAVFAEHLESALLGVELTSIERLHSWEELMLRAPTAPEAAATFAAVRIATHPQVPAGNSSAEPAP